MPICDINANPPIPQGLLPLDQSGVRVTPEMQQWAASFAYSSDPIGSIHKKWFGNLPIVSITLCHSYTIQPDGSQVPGAYHGSSLFYPTSSEMMPPPNTLPKTLLDLVVIASVLFGTTFAVGSAVMRARQERQLHEARIREELGI
jgi:hypothetical protein